MAEARASATTDADGSPVDKKPKTLPILNQSAMDRPVFSSDFVETEAWRKAQEKIADPTISVLTFSGSTGSGKSTLAMELCANRWPHDKNPDEVKFIFRQFNCENLDRFYSDLGLFYRDLDKKQVKLSQDHARKWDILVDLFFDMNKYYPDYVKLFILDDAEDTAGILDKLNHISKVIKMKEELTGKWKLLLTTQKKKLSAMEYSDIQADDFIDVDGFSFEEAKKLFRFSDLDDTSIKQIIEKIGTKPLTLKICMNSLKANQIDAKSQSVRNLLKDIETEANVLIQSGQDRRENSALVAIKLSIERLLAELPHKYESTQILKTLTMFNEKNITTELLLACAETCVDKLEQATTIVNQLISRLIERGICTRRSESSFTLFNLHNLVKQSIKLFVKDEERIPLIERALIALTRVMPKDDRKHQARLVGFYGEHGKSVDVVIKSMKLRINREQTPFILFLHCNMLIAMGYCLLAKRAEDHIEGVKRLKEARDKYCELVLDNTYASLTPPPDSSRAPSDPLLVELGIARRLFVASRNLDLSTNDAYKQYIVDLPLYHRLTKKDLGNMVNDPSTVDLVNDHLSRDDLEKFKRAKKVMEDNILAKEYLAEVLAQIFCVWSKVYRMSPDSDAAVDESIVQAEAAVQIYKNIFNEYKVYLLTGLITEREMLSAKIQAATTANEVERILSQLEELTKVGEDPRKKNAYEAGLVRSDLSKDSYHQLLCKEAAISCQGRLYDLKSRNESHYKEGKRLFEEVEVLANSQVHGHSAVSVSYRNFARFLFNCKKYGPAVISILRAMMELQKSLLAGTISGGHPELTHPRFKPLYSCLGHYYQVFSQHREKSLGYGDLRNSDKLLNVDMAECSYLIDAVDSLPMSENDSAADATSSSAATQPSESGSTVDLLETIHDSEIQDLGMAESLPASQR